MINKENNKYPEKQYDITIIGGLGHVGLPLGIVFADKNLKVCLYDIDKEKAEMVSKGEMPFIEYEAEPILKKVLANKKLQISHEITSIAKAKYVIISIGTPVDEYLNPKTLQFLKLVANFSEFIDNSQTIIVRSTVYPNTCKQMQNVLGKNIQIAYCPERIVQGYAVKELNKLPQIVSGLTEDARRNAVALFDIIAPKIIETSIAEAEMIKLFSNAWRYIQFAIANQFYMICDNFGVDYDKVRNAIREGYGRAATLPSAGFAAGPCLLKDTMQLAAFDGNRFLLGHSAMLINEGLPNFVVEKLRKQYDLSTKKVGILGMAFKADVDDIRDSLSFKLGKVLRFHNATIFYSDEYASNPDFVTKEEVIKNCDIIIIGVPHTAYKTLEIPTSIHVVDLWGIYQKLPVEVSS